MFIWLEIDFVDFGPVEDMGTTFPGVSEDQVVGLRTNDIPSVTAWAERDAEVGIYPIIRKRPGDGGIVPALTGCSLLGDLECGTILKRFLAHRIDYSRKLAVNTFFWNP